MHKLIVEPLPYNESTYNTARVSRRETETRAWQSIVRRELGEECIIEYDQNGGPIVSNRKFHIGVSHSSRSVAVLISNTPCAVDIELRNRNFTKVLNRFLTKQEQDLCSNELDYGIAWCAKETLYKLYREKGTSLLHDLSIISISVLLGKVYGTIPHNRKVEMDFRITEDEILVYTV